MSFWDAPEEGIVMVPARWVMSHTLNGYIRWDLVIEPEVFNYIEQVGGPVEIAE